MHTEEKTPNIDGTGECTSGHVCSLFGEFISCKVAPILNNIPIFATCIVPPPATCGKGLKGNRV